MNEIEKKIKAKEDTRIKKKIELQKRYRLHYATVYMNPDLLNWAKDQAKNVYGISFAKYIEALVEIDKEKGK